MKATRWIPVVILALCSPVCAQDKPVKGGPAGGGTTIQTDREVTLSVKGGAIDVKPRDALVKLGDSLDLRVVELPGGAELEIDFLSAYNRVGPFPWQKGNNTTNPKRGRYVLGGANTTHTTTKSDAAGYFKYQVIVRMPNGDELSIDPGVIIKEGG